ncbi:MAG TPA: hypothetical protein VN881_07355 [Candidatus Acidoferrales bacterium]|jgi:hypothetical protein|nr:hypothetical protein [Candidatus Acidoferrales bacterium]
MMWQAGYCANSPVKNNNVPDPQLPSKELQAVMKKWLERIAVRAIPILT